MSTQQHVIRKVVFEVYIPSEDMGHDTHELFSDVWRNVIARQLEALLDKHSSHKEVISIDRLEIDLDELQHEGMEEELSVKVKEAIEEKLLQVINAARISSSPEVYDGSDRTTVTFRSTKTSRLELLIHFLQTGTMPWWARNEETPVPQLFETLLQEEPVQLRIELTKLLGKSTPRKRFIYQLHDRTIVSVLSLFDPAFTALAHTIVRDMEELHSGRAIGSHTSSALRAIAWEYFIEAVTKNNIGTSENEKREHIVSLVKRLRIFDHAKLTEIVRHAGKQSLHTPGLKNILETAAGLARTAAGKEKEKYTPEEEQDKHTQEEQDKKKARKQPGGEDDGAKWEPERAGEKESNDVKVTSGKDNFHPGEDKHGKAGSKESTAEKLKKLFGDTEKSNDELAAVLSDGIYINNAGLVVLWPYLGAFFTQLELMKENQFIDEEAAHRAAHLLQYIATASEPAAEEHELVLNKLLCGLSVEDPISRDFIITEAEKTECENLLNAVVNNWSALKRSSSQALRNTFLVKEGLLRKESDRSLKIERQSVDMLIDRLPWSISIIKLPWCDEMLYVEW